MSAAPQALPARIRLMDLLDLPEVLAIEDSAYEFPWTSGIFRDCLLAGYSSWVLLAGQQVIGYGIMSLAAGEAHLLNLALSRTTRRLGFGRQLLEHLLECAARSGAQGMYLEVRPSNTDALALYERTGFTLLGRRRGYYRTRGGTEDAIVLLQRLPRLVA